jgi:hypothetical protein
MRSSQALGYSPHPPALRARFAPRQGEGWSSLRRAK